MKSPLRKKFLSLRNSYDPLELTKKNEIIAEKLLSLREYKEASTVLFYVSFDNEVNTHNLIEKSLHSKTVVIPFLYKKEIRLSSINTFADLKKNRFGILEPKAENITPIKTSEIEIAFIPGIVFSQDGNRVGFGTGYFDRLLSQPSFLKIGLAFSFQVISSLPAEGHDIQLDLILTERSIIKCKRRAATSPRQMFGKGK